jgi:hypothetical protein
MLAGLDVACSSPAMGSANVVQNMPRQCADVTNRRGTGSKQQQPGGKAAGY